MIQKECFCTLVSLLVLYDGFLQYCSAIHIEFGIVPRNINVSSFRLKILDGDMENHEKKEIENVVCDGRLGVPPAVLSLFKDQVEVRIEFLFV